MDAIPDQAGPTDPSSRREAAGLRRDFERFLARVDRDAAAAALAAAEGTTREDARRTLDIYFGEAAFGLRLIAADLAPGARVLEVGAGAGLICAFLQARGVDAVGLEPAESGFGFMRALSAALASLSAAGRDRAILEIPAAALDPERHGAFDLIFSVNVIEHVGDLPAAFAAMAGVLAPQGLMIHHCPNYTFPYEPHFGIPLVPFAPRATAALFAKAIGPRRDLWDGLNFVTAGDIRRIARRENLVVDFERGALAASLRRLAGDAGFAARHPLARFGAGLAPLLELAPPDLATPMTMRLRKAGEPEAHASR